jgi:hypothetical protein
VITSGFDCFPWWVEAGVVALMGGGMLYHLIHDGGAWFWFLFPAAAATYLGWLAIERPTRRRVTTRTMWRVFTWGLVTVAAVFALHTV